MGERNTRIGRAAVGGGDTGYDLERDPFVGQGGNLLTTSAEDERIAALEPQHALALLR